MKQAFVNTKSYKDLAIGDEFMCREHPKAVIQKTDKGPVIVHSGTTEIVGSDAVEVRADTTCTMVYSPQITQSDQDFEDFQKTLHARHK